MICLKIAERPKALSIHLLPKCPKYLYIQFKNHFDKVIKWIYRFTKKYWYLQIWNACRQGVPFDSYHNSKGSLVRCIIPSERSFRSISFWRLEFTSPWMCKSVLEPGKESKKASWGWYQCRNLKYEWQMRVILYRVNKGIQAIESSVMLKRITRSSEWWWVER